LAQAILAPRSSWDGTLERAQATMELALLATVHAEALRECCSATKRHHLGLHQAVRHLRGRLSSRLQRKLRQLDIAYHFARHVTKEGNGEFLRALRSELHDAVSKTDGASDGRVGDGGGRATFTSGGVVEEETRGSESNGAHLYDAETSPVRFLRRDDPPLSTARAVDGGRCLRRRAAVHEAFLPLAPACPTRAGVTEESQEAKDGASPPEVLGRPSPSLASTAGLGQLAARVDAALAGLGTATHVDPVVAAQVEVLRAFTAAAFAVGGAPPADRRSPSPRRPRCDAFGTFDVLD